MRVILPTVSIAKVAVFFSIGLFLHLSASAKKVPGILINNDNDTMEVRVKIPLFGINYIRLQRGIKCIDTNNLSRRVMPHQAKEIQFTYDYQDVVMSAQYLNKSTRYEPKGDTTKNNIFLKFLVDGELSLYEYYRKVSGTSISGGGVGTGGVGQSAGGRSIEPEYVFKDGRNSVVRRISKDDRRRGINRFIMKCTALNFEHRSYTMEAKVAYYNEHCAK